MILMDIAKQLFCEKVLYQKVYLIWILTSVMYLILNILAILSEERRICVIHNIFKHHCITQYQMFKWYFPNTLYKHPLSESFFSFLEGIIWDLRTSVVTNDKKYIYLWHWLLNGKLDYLRNLDIKSLGFVSCLIMV